MPRTARKLRNRRASKEGVRPPDAVSLRTLPDPTRPQRGALFENHAPGPGILNGPKAEGATTKTWSADLRKDGAPPIASPSRLAAPCGKSWGYSSTGRAAVFQAALWWAVPDQSRPHWTRVRVPVAPLSIRHVSRPRVNCNGSPKTPCRESRASRDERGGVDSSQRSPAQVEATSRPLRRVAQPETAQPRNDRRRDNPHL